MGPPWKIGPPSRVAGRTRAWGRVIVKVDDVDVAFAVAVDVSFVTIFTGADNDRTASGSGNELGFLFRYGPQRASAADYLP